MAETAHIQKLYDAIEALPEGVVGELIDGQLYTQPLPAGPQTLAASRLGFDLGQPFDRGRGGPGGWWILDEPEIHLRLDEEVLVPDIGGWRRERMPEIPDDQRFRVAPDWICEVISPSTEGKDRELKMPVYAGAGVDYAWLVDPRARTVEAYVRGGRDWQLRATFRDDQAIRAAPFDAVAVPAPWV